MFIEKQLTAGEIVTIKITTGDEIIARLVEIKDNEYVISKPLALMATETGIGLAPFAFTISPDTKIPINRSTVVFCAKTDPGTAKTYIENTSSLHTV
jgi:hypothetical protein